MSDIVIRCRNAGVIDAIAAVAEEFNITRKQVLTALLADEKEDTHPGIVVDGVRYASLADMPVEVCAKWQRERMRGKTFEEIRESAMEEKVKDYDL